MNPLLHFICLLTLVPMIEIYSKYLVYDNQMDTYPYSVPAKVYPPHKF